MRVEMIGLARDHLAELLDGGVGRACSESKRAETIPEGHMVGIDRQRALVAFDRLLATSAISQYVAQIAQIEGILRRVRHRVAQQADSVVKARFSERDEARQMQRFRVLRMVGEHARIKELRFAESARMMERQRFSKETFGVGHVRR